MPKYFCDNCQNLLNSDTSNDELTFQCRTCFASYKSEPDDSLRFEETDGGNLVIFQTILNQAKDDPTGLKTKIDCPKCKNTLAKPVRLGDELRLIYVCESCGFQWVDMK